MVHHRDTETRSILRQTWRWLPVLGLFSSGLPSNAQNACDSTDAIIMDFPRIFGGYAEPWQQCGDTIPINDLLLIYSYPRCHVWAEGNDRSVKWSVDLKAKGSCKLIAFQELIEEPLKKWKRSDIIVQFADKKIFGLRSRDGRLTPIDPNSPPFHKTRSQ